MATFNARRAAPKDVTPLTLMGVRYEAVVNGRPLGYEHRGGIIAAFNVQTGEQLWHLQIYQTQYDGRWEKDIQEAYITKIEATNEGNSLLITNEKRKQFLLNLEDRAVTALKQDIE